jgi:hypothetical protein
MGKNPDKFAIAVIAISAMLILASVASTFLKNANKETPAIPTASQTSVTPVQSQTAVFLANNRTFSSPETLRGNQQ